MFVCVRFVCSYVCVQIIRLINYVYTEDIECNLLRANTAPNNSRYEMKYFKFTNLDGINNQIIEGNSIYFCISLKA